MRESTVLSATAGARSLSVKERAPEVARPEVTTADVLHRAADLLEEFGWCQGQLGSKEQGALCAAGAIQAAEIDLWGYYDEPKHREIVLSVFPGDWNGSTPYPLARWNDNRARKKAEVVALLRQTADCQQSPPKDGVSP